MNFALLLPAALAALTALLLPLLIHLARRSEQRPTDFAALRWLRQKPRPRHRIRFDERWLLLLRLLLLALLALWLARPAMYGGATVRPWVAVAPGIDPRALDLPADARVRWLAPGSPSIDTPMPARAQPLASLLRELDATLPADVPLQVVVPAQLSGADGERPRLSRKVEWRVVAGSNAAASVAAAQAPVKAAIRYAPDHAAALPYLRAAIASWSPQGTAVDAAVATAAAPSDPKVRNLLWLAPGPLPAPVLEWAGAGGTLVLAADTQAPSLASSLPLWRDGEGRVLAEGGRYREGRVLRFTRALTPQSLPLLLEPEFPRGLRALLSAPVAAPTLTSAGDYAPRHGGPTYDTPARDLKPWLALLIGALFVLERWLACRPRRGGAP
ncbi:BatA domain-containing protein [Lysobacter sp. 5GHs7-4]|uniref:BatA domain-containing protein n=1 Tax=Lysobacter sp. 5GHs7-4 TaxID=2904253 RepID=UPI001E3E013A|nr:BatA domain-containing protein [Lysobacter sp. 5GHs7-4]UHQ21347.1 BatA domain-containing protein [Lysobacter sp. 5GHs7-4]